MPVEKEIKKPVLEVVPTIEQTGKVAAEKANAEIDQLKAQAQIKQFDLAAIEYQKSKDSAVAGLGKAAEDFVKKGNLDDASLALGMAELLTQTGELGIKYTEEWGADFKEYTTELTKRMKKGLTDEDRKEAYLAMSVVYTNISNSARMEKLDYFTEKAKSPKYKPKTKKFVNNSVEGIKKLYSQGKMEEGDKALAYLTFYTDTILKKGIKGKEGRGAAESAIRASLAGDFEKGEKLFQKSIKDYGVTMAAKQLWSEYAKLESSYLMTSDVYGKDIGLEVKLKNAKKALDSRKVNKAFDLLSGFSKDMNKYVEKSILANLNDIQKDLKATPEVVEGYLKGLKQYATEFPGQVKKIVGKLEKVSNDSVTLLDKAETLEEDYKAGKGDEKKTKKFFSDMGEFNSDLEDFAKKRKDAIGTASTGVLLMGNIMSEKQFKQVLKMGNVEYVRKEEAMKQGDTALKNMKKSLDLIIKEGPDSKKAKKAYENAVYAKTGALAMLDLERLPYEEEEAKFAFFSDGAMKVYDKCTKGEAAADVWKLNDTLFNMESAVLASDDKLFATKEADLQKGIIGQSKMLAGHYTAKIDGKKALVLDKGKVATYAYNVGKDAEKLGKKIENAEKINMAVKLAASFVHPSLFIATTVEMAVKEYEVTEKITWSTGLMLAASAIAFRHAAIFKGVSLLKGGTTAAKIAKVTLTGMELGMGGVLMAHGGMQTYHAFKAGEYAEGATTLSMFALPLLYAVARKPMMTYMGKKVPGFRQFGGEFVTEAAISKQGKKFGLMNVKKFGAKVWEKGGEYAAKTWEEVKAVPEMVKVGVKGAPVPVFVPGPMMFLVGIQKVAKAVKKPKKVLNVLKKVTTGDKKKYAEGMKKQGITEKEGVVGENFYDTITTEKNLAEVEESLGGVRRKLTGKDKSEMYKVLNNEIAEGAEKTVKDIFGQDYVEATEKTVNIGILSLDKGKTWLLNNIHKAFGDAGLFIYFKAAKNLETKFGIKAIKTSAQGDELVVVFTGKNVKKMGAYTKAFEKEIVKIAEDMGFRTGEPLGKAVTEFGAVEVEATAKISKEGKVSFATEFAEKPFDKLDSLLSTAEAKQMLEGMKSKGKDVSPLLPFLELPGAKLPKVEITKVEKLPETTKLDQVVNLRIYFNAKTKNALWEMTNHVGKGVSHVDNGIIGPSVLNQLGHPVTDVFSKLYHDALITSIKNHKLPVSVYDHGPMSVGFVFERMLTKDEMITLKKAVNDANEALATNPLLKEKGIVIEGVETFEGATKDAASHKVAETVMGHKIDIGNYEVMKQLTTVLHTEPAIIMEALESAGMDAKTLEIIGNIKKENVKWVRNPEDLVHYLKNSGVEKKTIMNVFDQLEVSFGEVVLNKNYTGIPAEYVHLVEGKPKVKLTEYIDIENGSSAGVFLGEMEVKGKMKDVAVKVYKNPWKGEWEHAAKYFEKEIENGQKLAELGLGPEVYGAVDIEGNMAYAMEVVKGYDSESLAYLKPSELAELIKSDKPGEPGTVTQLQQKYDELLSKGYYIGDFQYSILTEDQVLAGKPMKKGDVIFWDAGGSMAKLKPGEVDAPYIMKGADRAKGLSKIIGVLPEAVAEVKK
jgi:hypothetical protein